MGKHELVLTKETDSEVERFLRDNPPSSSKIDPHVGYIWCTRMQNSGAQIAASHDDAAALAKAAVADLETQLSRAKAENADPSVRQKLRSQTNELLLQIAKETNVTSGKWMPTASSGSIDELWAKVVRAIMLPDGPLNLPFVTSAKVSTVHYSKEKVTGKTSGRTSSEAQKHVICVYVNDMFVKRDVAQVYNVLLNKLRCKPPFYFKSDIYTLAGIYGGNSVGLQACMYRNTDFMSQTMNTYWNKQRTLPAKRTEREEASSGQRFEDGDEEEVEVLPSPPKNKAKPSPSKNANSSKVLSKAQAVKEVIEVPGSETEEEAEQPKRKKAKA